MELFLYLVVSLVDSFLSLIILAMLVRSIMSWFMMDGESKIYIFLCTITEPFIYPIRALFERILLLHRHTASARSDCDLIHSMGMTDFCGILRDNSIISKFHHYGGL